MKVKIKITRQVSFEGILDLCQDDVEHMEQINGAPGISPRHEEAFDWIEGVTAPEKILHHSDEIRYEQEVIDPSNPTIDEVNE